MKRIIYVVALIALLFAAFSCAKNKQKPVEIAGQEIAPESEYPPSTEGGGVKAGRFAFDLFRELSGEKGNMVYSPYSINAAMGMAYVGAGGNTAQQIAEVMKYPEKIEDLGMQVQKSLAQMDQISSQGKARLDIANALFNSDANRDQLLPEYSKYLNHFFDSEIYSLDFTKAKEAAGFINNWVEDKTEKRIKDLVQPSQLAGKSDGMILVNSVYFKSPWLYPFHDSNTKPYRFYTDTDGSGQNYLITSMMQKRDQYSYIKRGDLQILEMPFAEKELSMVFVLPENMDKFEHSFNHRNFEGWLDDLNKPQMVQVYVPRFRLEESLDDLSREFESLGVIDAFAADRADFSGILKPGSPRMYISDFVHKAFLEVSEEGAEAAAATQIGFAKTSLDVEDPNIPVFKLDRPFFAIILHRPTREILFFSKVVEPETYESK